MMKIIRGVVLFLLCAIVVALARLLLIEAGILTAGALMSKYLDVLEILFPGASLTAVLALFVIALIVVSMSFGYSLRAWWGSPSSSGETLRAGGQSELISLTEAARLTFEETKECHGYDVSEEAKLRHHVVNIAIEAEQRPNNMTIWGCELPSTRLEPVPSGEIETTRIAPDGACIYADAGPLKKGPKKWDLLHISKEHLDDHISRMKQETAAGQQPQKAVIDENGLPVKSLGVSGVTENGKADITLNLIGRESADFIPIVKSADGSTPWKTKDKSSSHVRIKFDQEKFPSKTKIEIEDE